MKRGPRPHPYHVGANAQVVGDDDLPKSYPKYGFYIRDGITHLRHKFTRGAQAARDSSCDRFVYILHIREHSGNKISGV